MEERTIKLNPLVIIAFLIQLIFIIFASIVIYNTLHQKDQTANLDVDNFSSIPDGKIIGQSEYGKLNFELDETKKNVIENILYNIVYLNNSGSISNKGAKIREGSVRNVYIEDLKVYLLNFIVDIEDLQQSYRITYRWADQYPNKSVPADMPAIAFCPQKNELIYGDFNCKDDYNNHGADIIVYGLLRYKIFSSFTVGLSGDVFNGEPLSLRINTISDEKTVEEAAVAEVSDYLSELGFNLDDFNYVVGERVCCALDYIPE